MKRTRTNNYTVLMTAYFIAGLLLLVQICSSQLFNLISNSTYIDFLKIQIVFVIAINFVAFRILKIPKHHPYFIFTALFVLFLISRIVLDILGLCDIGYSAHFMLYEFSEETQSRTLHNLLLALYAFQFGCLIAFYLTNKRQEKIDYRAISKTNWLKLGIIIIGVFCALLLVEYYKTADFVRQHGYFALQRSELHVKSYYTYIIEQVAWAGIAVFLAGMPTKKLFKIIMIGFIVPLLLVRIFSGVRGLVMCVSFVFAWYYVQVYKIRVSYRFLVIVALPLMIAFLLYIQSYRVSQSMQINQLSPAAFRGFFYSQGFTINTLMFSVEHHLTLVPDFGLKNLFADLYALIDKAFIRFTGQRELSLMEKLRKYGYSGYLLTYRVNPSMFVEGRTMGTSYVAEFFLLGMEKLQLIGGFIFGYLFITFINNLQYKNWGIGVIILLLPEIIYLPRYAVFGFLTNNLIKLIVFFSFISLSQLLYIGKHGGAAKNK